MFKRIAAVAGTAVAAAAVGGSALALASTHPAASGTEHLQLMSTSSSSSTAPVVAYGNAFTAGGVDHEGKGNVDTVVFANGTFKITHKMTGSHQSFNPKTCLLTATGTATYTLSDGTGAYKGLTGSGHARVSILAVAARNSQGKCSKTEKPAAFEQLIDASGPASLP
jgi:hypothetical protein